MLPTDRGHAGEGDSMTLTPKCGRPKKDAVKIAAKKTANEHHALCFCVYCMGVTKFPFYREPQTRRGKA